MRDRRIIRIIHIVLDLVHTSIDTDRSIIESGGGRSTGTGVVNVIDGDGSGS